MAGMGEPAVVLIDPYHPYAEALVEACYRSDGLRAVCLHSRRSVATRAHISASPVLRDPARVAAHLVVRTPDASTGRALAARFDVVAVIPHEESQVEHTVQVAEGAGVEWVPGRTLARFRDKYALKAFVREAPGAPRMNASTRVASVADVRRARAEGPYDRFVLKPNDGVGNSRIGFFGPAADEASIAAHLDAVRPSPVVMEEYLDGPEFCINGQVDGAGDVITWSVYRTVHHEANGRARLARRFELVRHDDPMFAATSGYAASVIRAAGLRRSPFHMELVVDDRGPCMIEVGARLAGAGMAVDTGLAHGGTVDLIEIAAAHYTGRTARCSTAPDWQAYDSRAVRTVAGVSYADERIVSLEGVREVEALPEFVRWVFEPRRGQRTHVTRDFVTIPWQATLAGDSQGHLDDVEDQVRGLLRWNQPASAPRTALLHSRGTAERAWRVARRLPVAYGLQLESVGRVR